MSRKLLLNDRIFPLSLLIDLIILNLSVFCFPILFKYPILFHTYISVTWLLLASLNNYYRIDGFTNYTKLLRVSISQYGFYFLVLYAFIGFFKQPNISRLTLGLFFVTVTVLILVIKIILITIIKYRIRKNVNNNHRVIIIGKNKMTASLSKKIQDNDELGLSLDRQFNPKKVDFDIKSCLEYVTNNRLKGIYASLSQLNDKEISKLIRFADNHLISLKFIPDNKDIFTKNLKLEYYDYFPLLSLRELPLEKPFNQFFKRLFDFLFSSLVVVLILSWLMPLIGILIKLDSKGPIYFRQNRPGFNEEGFGCYKFRTMRVNNTTEVSATRNDPRVTKLGKFLRKSSLDEIPQFVNVLLGQMSVVGPRPHLWRQNQEYNTTIQKYMLRHYVKPGITGLAQSKGYRGEIESEEDIINRTRYDFFYIENWSLMLDLKIIVGTILSILRGQDKAY